MKGGGDVSEGKDKGGLFVFDGTVNEKPMTKAQVCWKALAVFVCEVAERRNLDEHQMETLRVNLTAYLRFRLGRGMSPEHWVQMIVDMENVDDGDPVKMCARLDKATGGHYMHLVPDWQMREYKKRQKQQAPPDMDIKEAPGSNGTPLRRL